ncbi:hypothetical protein V6Z11_D11G223400 [Gossypium hirsutum]
MATMLIERKQVASVGKTCTAKSSPFLKKCKIVFN